MESSWHSGSSSFHSSSSPLGTNWSEEDLLVDIIGADEQLAAAADKVEPESFYAILNLSQDATDDAIKNAYKKLCIIFHPDKHVDSQYKAAAQAKFQAVQRAFDILSNPNKRYIYDMYGEEGLDHSWEISSDRMKTKEEIREEFERKTRMRRENEIESLIKSRGEVAVTLNAISLFHNPHYPSATSPTETSTPASISPGILTPMATIESDDAEDLSVDPPAAGQGVFETFVDRVSRVEMIQAAVKHVWETKITPQTDLSLTGVVSSNNGSGNGNLTTTIRHVLSPELWGEVSGTLGSDSMVQCRVVRNFTTDSFATLNCAMSTPSIPPTLAIVFGRRLSQKITGYINFNTGEFPIFSWGQDLYRPSSSTSLGLVRKSNNSSINFDIQAGVAHSSVSLAYNKGLDNLGDIGKGLRMRCSVKADTSVSLMMSVGADKRIGNFGRFGYGVDFTLSGIVFRLRMIRQGQKLSVPIIMTPERNVSLAFWTAILPIGIYTILDRSVFEPKRKKNRALKIASLRAENAEKLANRKKEALEAAQLMRESVSRKIESETKRNGLIIISALYGKLPPSRLSQSKNGFSMQSFKNLFGGEAHITKMNSIDVITLDHIEDSMESNKPYMDCTLVVQNMVNQSQLHISGGHSKSNLLGLYDPCFGEQKKLRIIYQFQDQIHEVEVDDYVSLAAPLRSHKITTQT